MVDMFDNLGHKSNPAEEKENTCISSQGDIMASRSVRSMTQLSSAGMCILIMAGGHMHSRPAYLSEVDL